MVLDFQFHFRANCTVFCGWHAIMMQCILILYWWLVPCSHCHFQPCNMTPAENSLRKLMPWVHCVCVCVCHVSGFIGFTCFLITCSGMSGNLNSLHDDERECGSSRMWNEKFSIIIFPMRADAINFEAIKTLISAAINVETHILSVCANAAVYNIHHFDITCEHLKRAEGGWEVNDDRSEVTATQNLTSLISLYPISFFFNPASHPNFSAQFLHHLKFIWPLAFSQRFFNTIFCKFNIVDVNVKGNKWHWMWCSFYRLVLEDFDFSIFSTFSTNANVFDRCFLFRFCMFFLIAFNCFSLG